MPVTSIKPDRIQNINYLANHISQKHNTFTDKPKYALLIGAGCSYSSRVPLGGGIIRLCQQLSFLTTETTAGRDVLKDFRKTGDYEKLHQYITVNHRAAFEAYITAKNLQLADIIKSNEAEEVKKLNEFLPDANWKDYEVLIATDTQYGYWQDIYSEDPKERQQLIERLIENKEPGGDYILLAYLVEKGLFSNILTTNFDDFINDALLYYTDVRCRFYADDELSQYISLAGHKPNIVKLHGDYRFANMKNTNDETRRLSANLEQKMGELLKEFGLVVIGYNGADHSIMNTLLHIKKNSPYSLIWCGKDENEVHWRVAELINNSKNSFFVKIESFMQLMTELYTRFCEQDEQCDLIRKAKDRQDKVNSLMEDIKKNYQKSSASASKKKKATQVFTIQALFRQAAQESDYNRKIQLYSKILSLENKHTIAFNNRGISFSAIKENNKAIQDYNKAIQLDPNNHTFYYNRAITWDDKGEYIKAIKDYNKAIKLKPDEADYYYNRGKCRQNLKQYEKAREDYEMTIIINENDPYPYNGIIDILREKGHFDLALQKAKVAISRFPDFAPLYGTLAEVYSLQGKSKAFFTTILKALKLGYPAWDYLDDPAYTPYKNEQRFIDLLAKYKKE